MQGFSINSQKGTFFVHFLLSYEHIYEYCDFSNGKFQNNNWNDLKVMKPQA